MTIELGPSAKQVIGDFVEDLVSLMPEIVGVDELIAGCEVRDLDPFAVGTTTFPRLIRVALRGQYLYDVMYRGFPTLALGDYCTVAHLREANRYEIINASGSTGTNNVDFDSIVTCVAGEVVISDTGYVVTSL